MATDVTADLGLLQRAAWGKLVASVVRRTGRVDLAEDAVAEAFAAAAARWAIYGRPSSPEGWLYTVAFRRVLAAIRAERVAERRLPLVVAEPNARPIAGLSGSTVGSTGFDVGFDQVADEPMEVLVDDRLQLILLCCHPALAVEARSALALRLVLGVPTDDIAQLFLVPTATMAARLTRAKRKIVVAGIGLTDPLATELGTRLDEVCRTIYLLFTTAYAPRRGDQVTTVAMASDAVTLGRLLHRLVPSEPQVVALLALMLLQHARRDARSVDGDLVTLAGQDRTRWHHDEIDEGLALVGQLAPTAGYAEELRLQASIAAEHGRAPMADATDWVAIAAHYGALERLTGSPIVRLNRAVAVAEADGALAGLAVLAAADAALPGHYGVAVARSEMQRRAGDIESAKASYLQALATCGNDAERAHLQRRLGELS